MQEPSEPLSEPGRTTRWRSIVVRACVAAAVVAGGLLVWPSASSNVEIQLGRIPRVTQRSMAILYLDLLLGGYFVAWVAVFVGLITLCIQGAGRRRGGVRLGLAGGWRAKLLLLGVSVSISLLALEAGAAVWQSWLHRRPRLPTSDSISATAMPRLPGKLAEVKDGSPVGALRILVIGESSGRGEPYHPHLSVGQIVGWYLETVFPGRKIEVDIWAMGGATLEDMHKKLAGLTYRPDVLIVYVGHNEFIGHFSWSHEVDFYDDDFTGWALPHGLSGRLDWSPLCRLILANRERQRLNVAPDRFVARERVDRPVCTVAESGRIRADFRTRLEEITSYCELIGTLPILIIPASGDAIFDPNRSILERSATKAERAAFAREAARAAALERTDPVAAIERNRQLIKAHPEFADIHFRLAELLNRRGEWAEAREHYILARENDALPVRCLESFRKAYRDVAARHTGAVLIDGPAVLEAASRHGILDETFFHDGQHPNLRGYATLSQNVLAQLCERGLLGWPRATPAPEVDLDQCQKHFGIDARLWAEVCRREARFHRVTANVRFDPRARNVRSRDYDNAAARIESGQSPADAGIPGWDPPAVESEFRFIPVPALGSAAGKPIAWPGR